MVKIICDKEKYPTYLVCTLGLLSLGLILGHICQAPWRLFRVLMKFYVYICVPCMSFNVMPSILNTHNYLHLKNITNITHGIVKDAATTSIWWGGTVGVFGLVAFYKHDRSILLHGALAAQFIVHANDLSFGKKLLETSCCPNSTKMNLETSCCPNSTKFNFDFLELPDTIITFLIFLPLTNGIVVMSKQPLSFRNFILGFARQVGKMAFSYLGFFAGLVYFVIDSKHEQLTPYFAMTSERFTPYFAMTSDVISFSETMLTLLTGVYLYHVLMNMQLKAVNLKLCFCLVIATNIGFTLVSMGIFYKDFWTTDWVILLSSTFTPSSLFVQYYILKHTNKTSNYIMSFVTTIFMGTIVMYVVVLVASHANEQNNLETYDKVQRFPILILGILFHVPAVMMFVRLQQSRLRMMIMFIMISSLCTASIQAACFAPGTTNNSNFPLKCFTSAISMINFIFGKTMIGFATLYQLCTFVSRNMKCIVFAVFSVAATATTALYTSVLLVNTDYTEYRGDVFILLDLTTPDTIPIGSISYYILQVLMVTFYIIVMLLFWRASSVAGIAEESIVQEDPYTASITSEHEPDDAEKFTPVRVYFCYAFFTIILGLIWNVGDLIMTAMNYKNESKTIKTALLGIDIVTIVMTDLSGLVLTLVFCVSPGRMEKEFERLSYFPRYFKYLIETLKQTGEESSVGILTLLDTERCRKFVLYHRETFINLYLASSEGQEAGEFKGTTLVEFLLDTEVAESPGEAMGICGSCLKGGVLVAEQSQRSNPRQLEFSKDTNYFFRDLDELPHFGRIASQNNLEFW